MLLGSGKTSLRGLTKSSASYAHVLCFGISDNTLHAGYGGGNACISRDVVDDPAPVLELRIFINLEKPLARWHSDSKIG